MSIILLSACSNDSGSGSVSPTSIVTGVVDRDFPESAVSDINVYFEATITNMGSSNTNNEQNSGQAVVIYSISLPDTTGTPITLTIEPGEVGENHNCYDPAQAPIGATLEVGESCTFTVIASSNAPYILNGNIELYILNANTSTLSYTVNTQFLGDQILARTGQNASEPVDASYGMDGYYQAGVEWPSPRFSINNDAVIDNLTQLVWQKNPSNSTMSWNDALTLCNTVSTNGDTDWRLPNALELLSVVNIAEIIPGIWLNDQGFSNIGINSFWSSTIFSQNTSGAWGVRFEYGDLRNQSGSDTNRGAWCVRGVSNLSSAPLWQTGETPTSPVDPAPIGSDGATQLGVKWNLDTRYQVATDENTTDCTSDEAVTLDTLTGLMWQQNPYKNSTVGDDVTWSIALNSCNMLEQCSYDDWRLPNRTELYSLIDWNISAENNTPAGLLKSTGMFEKVKSEFYWSSSIYASDTSYFWVVSFENGAVRFYNDVAKVWCVRGGEAEPATPRFSDAMTPIGDVCSQALVDSQSDLMWIQNGAEIVGGSWQTSLASCQAARQCGYDDWTLPNQPIMETLINSIIASGITEKFNAWLDDQGFQNINGKFYWLTTPGTDNNDYWVVNLNNGNFVTRNKTNNSSEYNGWCVRGEGIVSFVAAKTSLGDSCPNALVDSQTGIMWIQNGNDLTDGDWQTAVNACQAADQCGYNDWSLSDKPTMESFITSLQNMGITDSFNTWLNSQGFSNIDGKFYWTSTPDAGNSYWVVNLNNGNFVTRNKANNTNEYNTWCMRD